MHAARARARLIGGFPRDSAKSLTSSRYYAYRVLVPDGNRFVRRDGGADGGKTARTIDPTILPARVLRASRGAFPADLRDFVRGCGGRRLPRDRGVVNGVVRVVGWWLQRRDVAAIKVALGREADRRIILTRSFLPRSWLFPTALCATFIVSPYTYRARVHASLFSVSAFPAILLSLHRSARLDALRQSFLRFRVFFYFPYVPQCVGDIDRFA